MEASSASSQLSSQARFSSRRMSQERGLNQCRLSTAAANHLYRGSRRRQWQSSWRRMFRSSEGSSISAGSTIRGRSTPNISGVGRPGQRESLGLRPGTAA